MLPPSLLPAAQWLVRRLPRGGHRLAVRLERCFALDEIVEARLEGGQRMAVRSRDVLQRKIFWFGGYERYTTELFRSWLAPGLTVLDLGANAGYFTLLAAAGVGPQGTVIAFEPVAENYDLLVRNVALNRLSQVRTEPLAVAASDSELRLYLYRKEVNSGMASLLGTGGDPRVETRPVAATSVDAYRARSGLSRVDVIKMDIQGGEGQALDGLRQTLAGAAAPVLLWELNPQVLARAGDSATRLVALLEAAGYRSFEVGERRLAPLTAATAAGLPDGSMLASWKGERALPRGWKVG